MASSTISSAIDSLSHPPELCAQNTSRSKFDGSDFGSFIDDRYAALGQSDYARVVNDHGRYHGRCATHTNDIRNVHGAQQTYGRVLAPWTTVKPISKELYQKLLDEHETGRIFTNLPAKISDKESNTRAKPNKPAGPQPDQSSWPNRRDASYRGQNPDTTAFQASSSREIRIRSRSGQVETVGMISIPVRSSATTSQDKTPKDTQSAIPAARTKTRSRSSSPPEEQPSSRWVRIRGKNGQESVMAVPWSPPASIRAASSGRSVVPEDKSKVAAVGTHNKQNSKGDAARSDLDLISQLIKDPPKSSKEHIAPEIEPVMSGGLSGRPSVHLSSRATSISSSKKSAHSSKSSTGAILGKAITHDSSSPSGSAGRSRVAGGSAEKRASPNKSAQGNGSKKSSSSSTTTSVHHFANDDGLQTTSRSAKHSPPDQPTGLIQARVEREESSASAKHATSTRDLPIASHMQNAIRAQNQPRGESEASSKGHSPRSSLLSSARSTPPSSLASRDTRKSARDASTYEHPRARDISAAASLHSMPPSAHSGPQSENSYPLSAASSHNGSSLISLSRTWPVPSSSVVSTSDSPPPFSTSRAPIAFKDWMAMQERGLAAERQGIPTHAENALNDPSMSSRMRSDGLCQKGSPYDPNELAMRHFIQKSWASSRSTASYDTFPNRVQTMSNSSQSGAGVAHSDKRNHSTSKMSEHISGMSLFDATWRSEGLKYGGSN